MDNKIKPIVEEYHWICPMCKSLNWVCDLSEPPVCNCGFIGKWIIYG